MSGRGIGVGKIIVLLLFITGCGLVPTPYQKDDGWKGGYVDQHLKDNIYMVTFSGNMSTDRATVSAYAYRRAGEVCRENGYRNYRVLDDIQGGSINAMYYKEQPEVSLKIECIK